MHRRSLSAVTWWNALLVDVKMESYVNKYGSTERNQCFANRDGCLIKWNLTLKSLEILFTLDHIVKGNNIAEVCVGRGMSLIHDGSGYTRDTAWILHVTHPMWGLEG